MSDCLCILEQLVTRIADKRTSLMEISSALCSVEEEPQKVPNSAAILLHYYLKPILPFLGACLLKVRP